MNRKEFEELLLSEKVVDAFLGMPRNELETSFGGDFTKAVDYGNQNNAHHQYELFEHILRTVESINSEGLSQDDLLKLKVAAFFHDIAKPSVAKLNEKTGQTQYIGHAKASAEMSKDILKNLGYSENEIAEICFLIQNHDEFISIANVQDVTEERISKILSSISKKTEGYNPTISSYKKLLVLCRADAIAQSEVVERNGEVIDTRAGKLERYDAIENVLPKAIGFSQETEIGKLEKRKNELQVEPAPIVKNGKVVNQKQIDSWKSLTPDEIKQKMDEIDEQIAELRMEKDRLLERNEGKISLNQMKSAVEKNEQSKSYGE